MTDAMKFFKPMLNGRLLIPIVIGMAALMAFYGAFQLLGSTGDMNDKMGLVLLAFSTILFFCGALAAVLTGPQKGGLLEKLKASLLAACIPVLALDLFMVSAYLTNTSQFYSGYYNDMPVRPTEPPFFPVYLLIMAIISTIGLVTSGMGGIMVRWLQE